MGQRCIHSLTSIVLLLLVVIVFGSIFCKLKRVLFFRVLPTVCRSAYYSPVYCHQPRWATPFQAPTIPPTQVMIRKVDILKEDGDLVSQCWTIRVIYLSVLLKTNFVGKF